MKQGTIELILGSLAGSLGLLLMIFVMGNKIVPKELTQSGSPGIPTYFEEETTCRLIDGRLLHASVRGWALLVETDDPDLPNLVIQSTSKCTFLEDETQ